MYELGQIVETKKPHVCGNHLWKIIRVGADIKLECVSCQRVIMMSSFELDKKIKKKPIVNK